MMLAMLPALSRGHRKPKVVIGGGSYATPDLVNENFDAGTLGLLTYPWEGVDSPTRQTIVDDPTGFGRGKVLRIDYTSPAPGITRAVNWQAAGSGYGPGQEFWFRADFYLTAATGTAASPNNRKLIYWQRNLASPDESFMILHAVGTSIDSEVGWASNQIDHDGLASVAFDTWFTLECRTKMNSAYGVADGEIEVIVNNGTPATVTGIEFLHQAGDYMQQMEVGDQVSGSGAFAEYRLIDRVAFSTQRIGP